MSGANKHIRSGDEVSQENDPMQKERSLKESEALPIPSTDDPVASRDSKSQGTLVKNGSQTPPKNPSSGASTPPKCDSPKLRRLLSSSISANPALIVDSELQASMSSEREASTVPGASEIAKTEGGNASAKIRSPEVIEASVPEDIAQPEEGGSLLGPIRSADTTDSIVPAATAVGGNLPEGELSGEIGDSASETKTDAAGSNFAETVSTKVVGDNDSTADSVADAPESNVPADLPPAEAKEACIPEAVPNVDANVPEALQSTTDNVPASVPPTESEENGGDENMTTTKHSVLEEQIEIDNAKVHEPAKSSDGIKVSKTEPHTKSEVDKAPTEQEGDASEIVMDASVTKDQVSEIKKADKSSGPSPAPTEETMAASEPSKSAATRSGYLKVSKPEEMVDKISESKCAVAQNFELVEEPMKISEPEKSAVTADESKDPCDLAKESAKTPETRTIPLTDDPVASKDSNSQGTLAENGSQTPPKNPASGVSTTPKCGSPQLRRLLSGAKPELIVNSELQASMSSEREASTIPGAGEVSKTEEGNASVKIQSPEVIEASAPEIALVPEAVLQVSTSEVNVTPGAGEISKSAVGKKYIPASEPMEEAMQTSDDPKTSAATVKEYSQVPEPTGEAMETSEPATCSSGSGQTSKPNEEAIQEPGKIDSKEAERSPVKRPAKGRLEDIKSDEPKTPKSPSRRSSRLQALQRTHSESPSPKKERKTVRSTTLERVPSDDKMGVRTRGRRVGSTSSNSEIEGSGDEVKTKRVSRRDSSKK